MRRPGFLTLAMLAFGGRIILCGGVALGCLVALLYLLISGTTSVVTPQNVPGGAKAALLENP